MITANAASKAVLRAAIDEVCRENYDNGRLYYWPSYEIVMDVFPNRWSRDRRHVKAAILDYVMCLFEYCWCTGGQPKLPPLREWVDACIAGGLLPADLAGVLDRGDLEALMRRMSTLPPPQREPLRQLVAHLGDPATAAK